MTPPKELLAILETNLEQGHLNDVQELVLWQSWEGHTYTEIAESLGYDADYIKNVGAELWKLLSKLLGKQVTKSNFRSVLGWESQQLLAASSVTNNHISSKGQNTHSDLIRVEPNASNLGQETAKKHQDWGEAVDVSVFYGRTEELAKLEEWTAQDCCRLVVLLGMGGIGKTALAIKLAERIQDEFEYVIWRSLQNAPPIEEVLLDLIQFLSNQQEINLPETLTAKISRLLSYLRQHRCLVLLDNVESVLQSSTHAGSYISEYEGYGQLLRSVGEVQHQSCFILTSREKPKEVALLEGATLPVRTLHLGGLTQSEGQEIFRVKGCFGASNHEWQEVFEHYAGNPLALKIAASAVQELFEGNVAELMPYLRQARLTFEDIDDLLERQFNRLSEVERQVMYWLAVNRDPVSLAELEADMVIETVARRLLAPVQSLGRRCLIELSKKQLSLQPVVMDYVTNRLVAGVCEEVVNRRQGLLKNYALVKAQSKDYVRQAQVRFILQPVLDQLLTVWGSSKRIEHHLREMLARLREDAPLQLGYAGGNLLNLLSQLNTDLSNLDCSYLAIWQAYLVGLDLHHVNFAHSDLDRSVFTAVLNATLSVAFSPDGRLFAMGNADNKIRVWHTADYRELLTLKGHASWVCAVVFSPDGQTLASGSIDRTIKLWNLSTGECLKTLQGHTGWVWSVAFSPDGQTLASCQALGSEGDDQDRGVRLWNLSTGECLKTLQGHTGWVWSVAFSPDGQTLASGGDNQTLRLWDIHTGQPVKILQGHTNRVTAVTFSPDGQTLASCGFDLKVKLWDVSTGQCLKTLQGHTKYVLSAAFSADSRTLASGSQDCTVRLWDVSTGQCLKTLQGHLSGIWSVAFHSDGQTLASGSHDSAVKLYDTQTGQSLRTLQGYCAGVKSIASSPDGKILASGGDDKTVKLWNIQSGERFKIFQGHSGWIWCVGFNQDGQTLASSSNDSTIRLWNVRTGQLLRVLQGHKNLVFSVAFSPNGASLPFSSGDATRTGISQTLASGSDDQTVRLWDVQTGECLKILPHTGRVWSVAYAPNAVSTNGSDGQILASGSDDQTVRLWDVQTGECLKTLRGHKNLVFSVAFSPNGQTLASGSDDQTVRLWDVQTGECLKTLRGHTATVWSIAFSPDGQTLASSSFDQTVKLWHTQSGSCLKTLRGHMGEVWCITFSPRSQILMSASQDETVKIWDISIGRCIKTLRDKRPYENMNITKTTGLTEAQKGSLKALGAVDYE